jgi:hypothetical protein
MAVLNMVSEVEKREQGLTIFDKQIIKELVITV